MPERSLRVAVGDPHGRSSSPWRIWTGSATSDIYLGSRGVLDQLKVSLHQTGDWREHYHRAAPGLPRQRIAWTRPPEHLPGWTVGYRIHIPESELREGGWYPGTPPDVWLPSPGVGWTAIISVLPDSADAHVHVLHDHAPPSVQLRVLAEWPLPSGERAVVTANRTQIHASDIDAFRAEALDEVRERRPEGWSNVRALFSAPHRGVGLGIEIAIPDSD